MNFDGPFRLLTGNHCETAFMLPGPSAALTFGSAGLASLGCSPLPVAEPDEHPIALITNPAPKSTARNDFMSSPLQIGPERHSHTAQVPL
jgi:hypothetical protein